jgi:hypothetical protein
MQEEIGIGIALENETETEKESTIPRSRINRLLVATMRGGDENENEIGSSGMKIGRREREITEIGIIGSIGSENGNASGGAEIGIIRASAKEEKESATVTASCTSDSTASASTPTRTPPHTLRVQGVTLLRPLAHHAWHNHNHMWAASLIIFRCRKYMTTAPFRPARQRRRRRGSYGSYRGVVPSPTAMQDDWDYPPRPESGRPSLPTRQPSYGRREGERRGTIDAGGPPELGSCYSSLSSSSLLSKQRKKAPNKFY